MPSKSLPIPTLQRKTTSQVRFQTQSAPSDSLLLANQPSHPLDMIRHSRDVRVILLVLRKHKCRIDVYHDDPIDLVSSGSNLFDDVVWDVATDVVEVSGSRVGPDDGRPRDFPIPEDMAISDRNM